ncbi:hypothetical protein T4B_2170 [Trichinella pseudospiralis]|uniref:Uncharacterized protein n=1 Tax=Trichinella pseudospiralis TaxID=6337 RepID=A0A0V1GN24_TRIPS|nr:hypothetical protein T4B_2170 [Trichinella pseudospiralis]
MKITRHEMKWMYSEQQSETTSLNQLQINCIALHGHVKQRMLKGPMLSQFVVAFKHPFVYFSRAPVPLLALVRQIDLTLESFSAPCHVHLYGRFALHS